MVISVLLLNISFAIDGKSHTTYSRDEVQATRLMIDGKTCLLEKESDPIQLRSPSPGQLVNLLLENGDHVNAGNAYAEIEVSSRKRECRIGYLYINNIIRS